MTEVSNDYNRAEALWKKYGVEKDEDRPKANKFASEDSIFTQDNYDRTQSGRDVIINYQTNPDDKESKSTYLDIDKYYDEYHVSNKDTYFEDVALQYMTDVAAYFNIDISDEKGLDKLADIYEQIAEKNNLTTKRANYTSVEDYIVACNNEIAKRSWNGTLDDDFIDLSGIKVSEPEDDTQLAEGWEKDDKGNIKTDDGKYVEAINQEDLDANGYTVSEDGKKILDSEGNEIGVVVTLEIDSDGDGVLDEVKSYYKYIDNPETSEDEKDDSSSDANQVVRDLVNKGVSWVSDIVQTLIDKLGLSFERTEDGGYKIGDVFFDANGNIVEK